MGVTGVYYNSKKERPKPLQFLRAEFGPKVRAVRIVGSTWYAAYDYSEKQDGSDIGAMVVLTKWQKSREPWYGRLEFLYKAMSESVGPCDRKCPDSLLNMLTGPDNAWRAGCRAYNEEKRLAAASRPKLRSGALVSFAEPYPGGFLRAAWCVDARRLIFRVYTSDTSPNAGRLVRLARRHLNNAAVVG
jgi:hypothetical protein